MTTWLTRFVSRIFQASKKDRRENEPIKLPETPWPKDVLADPGVHSVSASGGISTPEVSPIEIEFERWIESSKINFATDVIVTGEKDPHLESILEEFPDTLVVPTVKSRSYVR